MTALTQSQLTVLRHAVQRYSEGQVRVPAMDLDRAEAIALWQDLVAAFGEPRGRPLSLRELALLRQRAWQRSAGHVALSHSNLTFSGGLALWKLTNRIEALLRQRTKQDPAYSGRARRAGIAAIGLAATQLAACTSLWGGNIKGNFTCTAPGGTCAPSTVIDDQALAMIQSARPPITTTGRPAARSFTPPQALTAGRSALLLPISSSRSTAANFRAVPGAGAGAGAGITRREPRVLKVVFPARVDNSGNFHEPRVVHTVADAGGWMQVAGGMDGAGAARPGSAITLASPKAVSPPTPKPGEEDKTDPASALPSQKLVSAEALPDPKVVAEARARGSAHLANAPVDAIRTKVEALLGAGSKAPLTAPLSAPLSAPLPPAPSGPAPETTPETHLASQCSAQNAAQSSATSVPLATNSPASFSGKVEE